jgi:ribosomal protein S20
MTIPAIPSNNNLNTTNSVPNLNVSQVRTDFTALTTAIKSDDLTAAQKAYAQLQADLGKNVTNGNTNMAAIGKALQAGDIKTAQQLLTNMQQAQHGHGHHGHKGGQGENIVQLLFGTLSTTDTTTDATSTNTSTTNFTA